MWLGRRSAKPLTMRIYSRAIPCLALLGASPSLAMQLPRGLAANDPSARRVLAVLAAEIRDADYRGDLARLRSLFTEAEPYTRTPEVARVAHYWRGFALWRRALNAANENGSVGDIIRDFEHANVEFSRALALDSTYVEAQIGLAA